VEVFCFSHEVFVLGSHLFSLSRETRYLASALAAIPDLADFRQTSRESQLLPVGFGT
jgi:hypothetical protein